jgi:hypothetical protein
MLDEDTDKLVIVHAASWERILWFSDILSQVQQKILGTGDTLDDEVSPTVMVQVRLIELCRLLI